jgi:hypothetical protein
MAVSRARNLPVGDAGHGAAKPLPADPAPQGFAPGGPRVGEVEVFHHDRGALVMGGGVDAG